MSFNSFQSPYTSKQNPTPTDTNLITNPSSYYQNNFQKMQTYKTSEFQTINPNLPSSISPNYLNVPSKFTLDKPTNFQAEKKVDNWKSSQMMTAKSMVFMGNQKQSAPFNPAKKTFAGLGKLSQMARTATKNFDDSSDFQNNKNSTQIATTNNLQDKNTLNFKKYGNSLMPESANFKNTYEKDPAVTASMFLNPNEEKTSVYKSFINYGSNNNQATQNKKNGGLDFLLKFKKEQEEKKQRDLNSLKVNDEKRNQYPKSNDNGSRNFLCPPQNNQSKIFHEHSAPDLGHAQKNYHHQPIPIHSIPKNEDKAQKIHNQFESPVHNTSPQNAYTYTNLSSKYSSPAPTQGPSPTFMKKFNSDKIDRYVPQKSFNSQTNLPSHKQGTIFPKNAAFTKKDAKVIIESSISTGEGTPVKDKFVSPAFFKNRQNKMFSDTKTEETTPSPSSLKSKHDYEPESPTYMKSAISDDGSNGSIEYIDGDLSSEQLKEWSLQDFELGDKLGKGAFGDVFIAREKHLGFMCVLKKMSKKRIKDLKRQQHVIRQLKVQMYLNHKHLTAMYGYFHDKENIYLILEYLPDGNLSQIKKRKKTSQKQTADILRQVCQGLSFMHKHNIIHRDIKPENIFVNEGYMKLGDFGCSVFTDGMRRTVVSCLQYSSPEQLSGECYNEKIDVWGIGILTYELLTGRSPYQKEIMNMSSEQIDFSSLKFPEQLKLSPLAKDFIISLLNVDPIDRLDIGEALEHKFITSNYVPPVILE